MGKHKKRTEPRQASRLYTFRVFERSMRIQKAYANEVPFVLDEQDEIDVAGLVQGWDLGEEKKYFVVDSMSFDDKDQFLSNMKQEIEPRLNQIDINLNILKCGTPEEIDGLLLVSVGTLGSQILKDIPKELASTLHLKLKDAKFHYEKILKIIESAKNGADFIECMAKLKITLKAFRLNNEFSAKLIHRFLLNKFKVEQGQPKSVTAKKKNKEKTNGADAKLDYALNESELSENDTLYLLDQLTIEILKKIEFNKFFDEEFLKTNLYFKDKSNLEVDHLVIASHGINMQNWESFDDRKTNRSQIETEKSLKSYIDFRREYIYDDEIDCINECIKYAKSFYLSFDKNSFDLTCLLQKLISDSAKIPLSLDLLAQALRKLFEYKIEVEVALNTIPDLRHMIAVLLDFRAYDENVIKPYLKYIEKLCDEIKKLKNSHIINFKGLLDENQFYDLEFWNDFYRICKITYGLELSFMQSLKSFGKSTDVNLLHNRHNLEENFRAYEEAGYFLQDFTVVEALKGKGPNLCQLISTLKVLVENAGLPQVARQQTLSDLSQKLNTLAVTLSMEPEMTLPAPRGVIAIEERQAVEKEVTLPVSPGVTETEGEQALENIIEHEKEMTRTKLALKRMSLLKKHDKKLNESATGDKDSLSSYFSQCLHKTRKLETLKALFRQGEKSISIHDVESLMGSIGFKISPNKGSKRKMEFVGNGQIKLASYGLEHERAYYHKNHGVKVANERIRNYQFAYFREVCERIGCDPRQLESLNGSASYSKLEA